MKLYACGCNLSGQISNPATLDAPWTLIKEWESQPKDSKFENKVFIITFGFSYCVYAHDNKIFFKGFNNSINEEIAIPKPLHNPANDPCITIINVSMYKNHIIVIQSNGNIWKLDLLDKIKQDRIDSVKMTKYLRETKSTRREHVTNRKEMRTMENGSTTVELNDFKQSPIHNQDETNESPIEIHQTETTAISLKEESDKIHTEYSQSKKCEIETLETKCTKNSCITQSTGRNVEFPVKDNKDRCSDGFTKDNELISVTQLNHLFTCELDVCDDQTEIELEEQDLKRNKDKENPDELRSKRQRISTRKRNHFVKAVCSDNIQLLLSEQGQVFHIPGRLDHFLGHVVTDIACGFDHSLALTRDGLVYSWGNGSRGQLGYSYMGADSESPREVAALSGLGVVQIAAGGWHSVRVY